jgi:uncharacterized protein YndB with AHSA1/START domain
MTDSATTPEMTEHDVYITRAFAAPREVVWRFWTEPERVAQWFGPAGFSTPAEGVTIELREGGVWNLTMVNDATGERFPMRGRITECRPPELLVMQTDADTERGSIDKVVLRIEFHDHGDRTRITLHQGPFSGTMRENTASGWEESFAKIDRILEAARA